MLQGTLRVPGRVPGGTVLQGGGYNQVHDGDGDDDDGDGDDDDDGDGDGDGDGDSDGDQGSRKIGMVGTCYQLI